MSGQNFYESKFVPLLAPLNGTMFVIGLFYRQQSNPQYSYWIFKYPDAGFVEFVAFLEITEIEHLGNFYLSDADYNNRLISQVLENIF